VASRSIHPLGAAASTLLSRSHADIWRTGFYWPRTVRKFWKLTKPRVVAAIMFTAIAGMLLGSPRRPPLDRLVPATVGIWLPAAAAAPSTV
jgi:heme O synthase-like polyprenyltransferase